MKTTVVVIGWLVSLVLIVLWIRDPNGPWEPWAALVALLTGPVLSFLAWLSPKSQSTQPEALSAVEQLIADVHEKPLSKSLPQAMRLAKQAGDSELERWCRLELNGYNAQGGMLETDRVPDYRMVTGQWVNGYGQTLDISAYPDLAELNRLPMREGVSFLEDLASRSEMKLVSNDRGKNLIRQHMGIELRGFQFHSIEVRTALSHIKNLLAEKLEALHEHGT